MYFSFLKLYVVFPIVLPLQVLLMLVSGGGRRLRPKTFSQDRHILTDASSASTSSSFSSSPYPSPVPQSSASAAAHKLTRHRAHSHLLIVGDPGTGTTHSLFYLTPTMCLVVSLSPCFHRSFHLLPLDPDILRFSR